MIELAVFRNLPLRGGFVLEKVEIAAAPMEDAIGRPALARTVVIGATLSIELRSEMLDDEMSVSLYHEVLEGLTVATQNPPAMVIHLNEADFEVAARRMHSDFGFASPKALTKCWRFSALEPKIVVLWITRSTLKCSNSQVVKGSCVSSIVFRVCAWRRGSKQGRRSPPKKTVGGKSSPLCSYANWRLLKH